MDDAGPNRVKAERDSPPTRSDIARRALAGATFLILFVLVAVSYVPGGPKVCREQIGSSGAIVELCRPIGTDDIVLVGLFLVLALFLLAPDLSEFGIPGLFNVKLYRRIVATEKKLEQTATDVVYLNLATASPSFDALAKAADSASARVRVSPPAPSPESRSLSLDRAQAEVALTAVAQDLDRYLRLFLTPEVGRRLRELIEREGAPFDSAEAIDRLRKWQAANKRELAEYARVRNAFVHYPQSLSDDEVHAAVNLAQGLLLSARESLFRPPP